MSNKVQWGIGVVAAIALIVSLKAINAPAPEAAPAPAPQGAITGPDIPFTYLNVNGVKQVYASKALSLSTTTPCTLQAPAATSTLVRASLTINTGSSTATVWDVAKDTSANGGYATTTRLSRFALGSGVLGTFNATTTGTAALSSSPNSTVDDINVFSPNDFLVWKFSNANNAIAIASFGADKMLGQCSAEWVVTGQ